MKVIFLFFTMRSGKQIRVQNADIKFCVLVPIAQNIYYHDSSKKLDPSLRKETTFFDYKMLQLFWTIVNFETWCTPPLLDWSVLSMYFSGFSPIWGNRIIRKHNAIRKQNHEFIIPKYFAQKLSIFVIELGHYIIQWKSLNVITS